MEFKNKIFSAHDQEDERRYVTYYQWVGFTLFFQVICLLVLDQINPLMFHKSAAP